MRLLLLAAMLAASTTAGCGDASETPGGVPTVSPTASDSPAAAAGTTPRLLLTFDDEPAGQLANGARLRLAEPLGMSGTVVAATHSQGIQLSIVAGETGNALRFPQPCDSGPGCLRSIVEIDNTGWLAPGDGNFSYGASILVNRPEIRDGGNVVQQGYSTDGLGQWKLQVDRRDGRPSCVIVGTGKSAGTSVTSTADVADGQWHDLMCSRDGSRWTITVDGKEDSERVAGDVAIVNDAPIRVGGKNTSTSSDPFFGLLDTIWFAN